MATKKEGYYTPITLRTGFFHSYYRTIFAWLLIITSKHLALFAGGIVVSPAVTILYIPFSLILIAATWTVRGAVDGFDELFNIFDEDSEREMKLYCSMDRPEISTQEEIRRLFSSEEAYEAFREKARRTIFGKSEFIPLSLGLIATGVYWFNHFFYDPFAWTFQGSEVYPWTHIHEVIFQFIEFPWIALFALSGLWLIVGYLNIVRLMRNQYNTLKIDKYAKHLQNDVHDVELMPYRSFYNTISMIGVKVYHMSSQAVGALVIASLWVLVDSLSLSGFVTWDAWILSLVLIPVAFLIFVAPQLSIHYLLADAKNSVSESLDSVYDGLNVKLIQLSTQGLGDIGTERIRHKEELEYAYIQIQIMNLLTDEVNEASTWTFKMPALLKLVGASLIPLGLAIMETFFISNIAFP